MSDWWQVVEDALAERSVEAPDPWATFDTSTPPTLTDEQRSFLAQLADQPHVRRATDEDAED